MNAIEQLKFVQNNNINILKVHIADSLVKRLSDIQIHNLSSKEICDLIDYIFYCYDLAVDMDIESLCYQIIYDLNDGLKVKQIISQSYNTFIEKASYLM